MTTAPKCPVCEAAHALCLSGAQANAADFLKAAIVQERKAKEKAEAERDELRAECERLQRIVAAATAYRASHAAIYDARKRGPNADMYLLFSDLSVAEGKLFAVIDAAEGGG